MGEGVILMVFGKPRENRPLFDKMHMDFAVFLPAGDKVEVSQSWILKKVICDLSLLCLALYLIFPPPSNMSSGRWLNTLIQ